MGIEPTRDCSQRILSPSSLPVPSLRQMKSPLAGGHSHGCEFSWSCQYTNGDIFLFWGRCPGYSTDDHNIDPALSPTCWHLVPAHHFICWSCHVHWRGELLNNSSYNLLRDRTYSFRCLCSKHTTIRVDNLRSPSNQGTDYTIQSNYQPLSYNCMGVCMHQRDGQSQWYTWYHMVMNGIKFFLPLSTISKADYTARPHPLMM